MTTNREGLTLAEWRSAAYTSIHPLSFDFASEQWEQGVDPTEWRAAGERFTPPYVRMETPWGEAQGVRELLRGIWFVDTPGHGGAFLSPERQERMHPLLRTTHPYHGLANQWYEEDCDLLRVLLNFGEEFAASESTFDLDAVARAFATHNPDTFKNWSER